MGKINLEDWIAQHKILYRTILFSIGIFIGIFQFLLLGVDSLIYSGFKWGFVYAAIFIIVDLSTE